MSSPSRLVIDPAMYGFGDHDARKRSSAGSLPPASKLIPSTSQSSNGPLAGWTPLISRTFSNDAISHNSTPSSKMLPSMYKHAVGASGSGPGLAANQVLASDYDYPGLNLTPFLTHNLNLLNNPQSAGNLSNNINFTPFYDKSMHLADFFMDSPIRHTPLKIETITPSKFSMHPAPVSLSRALDAKLNSALSLKRSITQIDTPARHPFKKYDTSNKDDDDQSDFEDAADNKDENIPAQSFADTFVTPSKKKVLNEVSGNLLNKTPSRINNKAKNLYQTPAKPTLVSSPSTVIMSSATRSPDNEAIKQSPASPTPLKDRIEVAEPVMGIFSERKSEPKPTRRQKNKSAGMSKFQIIFTDVHTLMNSRKKKAPTNASSSKTEKSDKKKSQPRQQKSELPSPNYSQLHPQSFSSFQHTLSSLSASQDYNCTMNTSREFSVLGNNSTVNTTNSNLNVTSDQSSFELMHGGLMSTPNSKFLLDHLFDRGSPQAVNQMTSSMNQIHVESKQKELHHMPPPPKTFTLQQAAQQALRQDSHLQMMPNMMMSTPQHEHVVNGPPGAYSNDDFSPSNKEPMAYMYQQLHQFQSLNSPSNVNLLNAQLQILCDNQQPPKLQGFPQQAGKVKAVKNGRNKKRLKKKN